LIIEKTLGDSSLVKQALQHVKKKGMLSVIGYSSAIPLAYVNPVISGAVFIAVAIVWFIPDKNIERAVANE